MSTIKERLERRLEVLSRWERNGPPKGRTPPKSKSDLLGWSDEGLGIEPIGHRNACTLNHPQNGALVRECTRLMTDLAGRRPRARSGTEADNKRLRQELRLAKDEITKLVGQWHTARAEKEAAERDKNSLHLQLKAAREELSELKRSALKVVALRTAD